VTYLPKEATERKELTPAADLWIDQAKNAAERDKELRLSGQFRHKGIAFVKFDLSSLNDTLINDARLALYLFDGSSAKHKFNVNVGIPQRNWNYNTLTSWSEAPPLGQEGPSFYIGPTDGWYEEDVTVLVRWAAYYGSNNGLMLYSGQNDYVRIHSSRATDASLRPKLIINAKQRAVEKIVLSGTTQKREQAGVVDVLLNRLLADVLEDPNIVRALKISFIPGMILGLLTLRWIEKRFAFLLGTGIVTISVLSVIIAERYG
jgi:hypothetical protein